jgi:hypothetical protein
MSWRRAAPRSSGGRVRGAPTSALRVCGVHGAIWFVLDTDGYYRCPKCRAASVIRRRAAIRARVIADAGGCCSICGYDRDPAALHFHHLDPTTKSFTMRNGDTRALERMQVEAAKCLLLCLRKLPRRGGVRFDPASRTINRGRLSGVAHSVPSGVAQWQSERLLTARLWVRVPPPELWNAR